MAALHELRREIDDIDRRLHDLLIRRIEIGHEVAKAKAGDQGPKLRPGREAQDMRTLFRKNRTPLSINSIYRVWREILSANLNQQISVQAAIFAPSNLLRDMSSEYCGTATKAFHCNSAETVLKSVSIGESQFGILPGFKNLDRWRWWPYLLRRTSYPKLHIVAKIPFITKADCHIEAIIVANQKPESSGDDSSIFAINGKIDLKIGNVIDSFVDKSRWVLLEVPGFIDELDKPTIGENCKFLGAFANSIME